MSLADRDVYGTFAGKKETHILPIDICEIFWQGMKNVTFGTYARKCTTTKAYFLDPWFYE